MHLDIATIATSTMISLLSILVGLYYFQRRYPIEKMTAAAEVKSDVATAGLTEIQAKATALETYDRMFALLVTRDELIAKQNERINSLNERLGETTNCVHDLELKLKGAEARARENETKAHELQSHLDQEIRARIGAQDERDVLQRKVSALETKLIEQAGEIQRLHTDIETLKLKRSRKEKTDEQPRHTDPRPHPDFDDS